VETIKRVATQTTATTTDLTDKNT